MVYYAGHGIEGSGKNWLIPVDAKLESNLDLPYEAIDLDRVMDSMSGAQVRCPPPSTTAQILATAAAPKE